MSERFDALPEEKKENIINACLDEFAQYGYKQASTNRIVKAAGISKGILFHYFESKKKLFLYLLDYSIKKLIILVQKYAIGLPTDIFEMLAQYSIIKLRVGLEEPRLYRILYDAYINYPGDIKSELQERYSQMFADQREQLFDKMDKSLLRDDVDSKTVINLIMDFLDGYYNRRIEDFKKLSPEELLDEFEPMKKEMMEALEVIKRGVYK